jgi:hypothetical protein
MRIWLETSSPPPGSGMFQVRPQSSRLSVPLAVKTARVVDELSAAGLTERQPDQADGRSSFAALTPQGRTALRRAWPVYREAIRRRLGTQLTPEQCLDLARLLERAARGTEISLGSSAPARAHVPTGDDGQRGGDQQRR